MLLLLLFYHSNAFTDQQVHSLPTISCLLHIFAMCLLCLSREREEEREVGAAFSESIFTVSVVVVVDVLLMCSLSIKNKPWPVFLLLKNLK